jgi:1-phosphofructokinase
MIVTLTPNPSNDRTVTVAGPLERGAVQRLLSVTMQAGGKGVNISRAAMSAGLGTEAVFPAHPDDPFVTELLSAGIACYPAPPAGDVRINLAITEPDGTTTKLNSPAPSLRVPPRRPWGPPCSPGPPPPPGSCSPARCHRVLPTAGTPSSCGRCAARRPGGRRHQRGPARGPRRGSPDAAPDLMKPNGEELASFVGGDEETYEADPPLPRPQPASSSTWESVRSWSPSAAPAPARHRRRRLARHPSPTTVVSTVGAGDSSLFGYLLGDVRGGSPTERLALAVAYGSAAPSLPGRPSRSPSRRTPSRS